MDIPALSVMLSQSKVAQQASVSVTKMAMDTATEQGSAMADLLQADTKGMELSVQPYLGGNLDVSV